MSIENPTLAHFRHFSSLFTNLPSTSVENPLQINPFMQNKANFRKSQMNVNLYNTTDYENIWQRRVRKNKPNSKPIQSQTKPIAERAKLMQCVYLQRIMKKNANMGYEKTKPIQTQFKANQSQLVKTGTRPKTQDTRPKIQILSLESGRKAGRLEKSIFCMVGGNFQGNGFVARVEKDTVEKKLKIAEKIADKMLKCRQYKYKFDCFF